MNEIKRRPLFLTAPLKAEQDRLIINAYGGQPMETWFGKVIFDLAGMTTKEKFPVLLEHDRTQIVGYGDKAWIEDQDFKASVIPSKVTEAAKTVLATLDEGFPWEASAGIWPEKVTVLQDEKSTMKVNGQEFRGPGEIWTASRVREISVAVLGRDDSTSVLRLSQGNEEISITPELLGQKASKKMNMDEFRRDHPELLATMQKEIEATAAQASDAKIAAERARIDGIMAIAGMSVELKQQAVKDGKSVEGAKALAWEAEIAARTKGTQNMSLTPAPIPAAGTTIPAPQTKTFLELVEEHQQKTNCRKSQAILAVRGKYPEIHSAWLIASKNETFINRRAVQ